MLHEEEYSVRVAPIRALVADQTDTVAYAFYHAARAGNLDRLRELLSQHPDINVNAHIAADTYVEPEDSDSGSSYYYNNPAEPSEPAICAAAGNGHVDVVCLLLALGADVNANSTMGGYVLTPLLCTTSNSHFICNAIDVVRLLLDNGADLNTRAMTFDGGSAEGADVEHVCWTTNDCNILDLLLSRGRFDLNEIRREGSSGEWAPSYKARQYSYTFAWNAVRGGIKFLDWAISRGLVVSDKLLKAVEPNDHEMLRYLVLELGLKDSNLEVLSYNMRHWRGETDEDRSKRLSAINLLLDTLPQDKMKQLPTVLCAAVCNGSEDMINFWLDWGVDVNGYSNLGLTALHQAAFTSCRPERVRLLLERGADVNMRAAGFKAGRLDHSGSTALHIAFTRTNFFQREMAAELLRAPGIDREARNDSGFTPLHCLAQETGINSGPPEDALQVLRDFVKDIKDINAVDHRGMTALHRAVNPEGYRGYKPRKEPVLILIRRGIDVSIKDNDGMTAADRLRLVHDVCLEDWIEESLCEAMSQGSISNS